MRPAAAKRFSLFAFLCLGWTLTAWAVTPLDPYLLRPGDVPSGCRRIDGFFPTSEKVQLFFDYKTYRAVLPPAIDRHAQSFDCAGNKGTIYFFAYKSAADEEAAELFAKPVLLKTSPAPLLVSWKNGFALVSFAQPPADLVAALKAKTAGRPLSPPPVVAAVERSTAAVAHSTATVVSISTATVIVTPTPTVPAPAKIAAPTPAPPKPPAPPLPAPAAPPAAPVLAVPASHLADLSDAVLADFLKKLDCRSRGLPTEIATTCGWIEAFKKGQPFDAIIPSNSAMLGDAYGMDAYGRLEEHYYEGAIGTGQPGEIAIHALHAFSGVDDIEAQAIVANKRAGKALPPSEFLERLTKQPRPSKPTVFRTTGRSLAMPLAQDRTAYFRKVKNQWILILVTGQIPDEQTRSPAVVAALD